MNDQPQQKAVNARSFTLRHLQQVTTKHIACNVTVHLYSSANKEYTAVLLQCQDVLADVGLLYNKAVLLQNIIEHCVFLLKMNYEPSLSSAQRKCPATYIHSTFITV